MTDDGRHGQVVTFYSYKGGTGRSMALANTAWILAANGKRVLVVDWDLESPGLHRFFSPFIEPRALEGQGVIDLIREYEHVASEAADPDTLPHSRYARVERHAFPVNWPYFPDGGSLDFLSAGRQNDDYAAAISGMNWDDFYDNLAGESFFAALREDMKRSYDYALIDSRTGFSDVASICTISLPDILVDCFTLSQQGIDGASQIARHLRHRAQKHPVWILPVPMRVDAAEKDKADRGRELAKLHFAGLPALPPAERDAYWSAISVPYLAYYAYEETLATFADAPGRPGSLLSAYEALVARITDGAITALPPMDEALRQRTHELFVRPAAGIEEQIVLRHRGEDAVWAEWIEHLLASAGVRVADRHLDDPTAAPSPLAKVLLIVSRLDAAGHLLFSPRERGDQPFAVYIGENPTLSPDVPAARSAYITGLEAREASDRILRLVGRTEAGGAIDGGPRFPTTDPVVFNVPARNARFTGREADLRELRNRLRTERAAVSMLPVALHGMGGIGKTQVALEYAYRFRNAYDVVWWVNADASSDVEASLYELGKQLRLAIPESYPEGVKTVLQALTRGESVGRWLLIFDNAEEPARLTDLMPRGHGHVLITSRDPLWGDSAQAMMVDVFKRSESVTHLVERVEKITKDDADRVANSLGDLPIAIAAAAAWLHETGTTAAEYLRQIESNDAGALPGEAVRGQRVAATWDLALERLASRSPLAYRLLQLCSLMAPEIALSLVYSDAMATALRPIDRSVMDRSVRGTLVQHINRLALLRLDMRGEARPGHDWFDRFQGGQIIVHRVLQLVIRGRMSDEEQKTARHEVHLMLAAARPQGDEEDPEQWPGYRVLLPHLDVSNAVECNNEEVRQLLIDRVRYNFLRGNTVLGKELAVEFDRAWTARVDTADDPDQRRALQQQILQLRFNLANIVRDQGQFEESLAMDTKILAEQQRLLGPEHPHTLMTAGSLAADLRGLGRYAEALAEDQQTYAATLDVFGEGHKRTLSALSNLAVSHRLTGDLHKALEEDDEAYRVRKAVLGALHPSTLLSATSLGRDLRDVGEYGQSVSLLRSVVEMYNQVFGPGSRQVLNAEANLAVSVRNAGNVDEAAVLLDNAYKNLDTPAISPSSPESLACRLSRSVTLFELDKLEEAEVELRAVRQAYTDNLGPTHPHTLVCTNNLAALARQNGEAEHALELAQTASDQLAAVLGPDHPYALAALMNLGLCLFDVDRAPEAYEVMGDAATRLARTLGHEHPHTLRCEANQALIRTYLIGEEPPGEAGPIIERLAQRIGSDHGAVLALCKGRLLRRIIDPHPF